MEKIKKELSHNALAFKCSFGGGDSGCPGIVYNNPRFKAKSGHDWVVYPCCSGPSPSSPMMQRQKKQLISEFIEREKDRKIARTCEELLKGILIDSINETFILELKDDMMDCDGVCIPY